MTVARPHQVWRMAVPHGRAHTAALMTYAALLGFAKSRLDVSFGVESEALVMPTSTTPAP